MRRTISKKKSKKTKSKKKKLKQKDRVIMYYNKSGGSGESTLKRLQTIIFESMFEDLTNILCGYYCPDIIDNIFILSKDRELLGSFARGNPEPKVNDSNYFFKGFQNYFLNNENAIYEVFVNGIIKEAMKKYNLELLGFNYIGNENDFELKKIQDVNYVEWQEIGKRIKSLNTSQHPRTTMATETTGNEGDDGETAGNEGEDLICELKYLKEIRGTLIDLTSIEFNSNYINELIWDNLIKTLGELEFANIAGEQLLNKLKEKGFSLFFSELLPIIIEQARESLGISKEFTENITTVFQNLNSQNILADQSFISLVKDMLESIKNVVSRPEQAGGGKFSLMNIVYKINSCITFAKFTKDAIKVCIEGYTLSKSITSTASNQWSMDAHQLNSLLSITNNYNSYDYKADIINNLMRVYKKKKL